MITDKLLDIHTLKLTSLSTTDLRYPGGLRLAVARSDDGREITFALYEEQFKGAAPEPEQEQLLQGPDGEAPASDPGIGAPGPLPDAGPQEEQVVEGIGSDADLGLVASLFRDEHAFRRAAERALILGFEAGFDLGKAWLRRVVVDARDDQPS